MSRPLILVLQLTGLVMIVSGFASDPIAWSTVTIGAACALFGGAGYRARQRDRA